MGFYTFVCSVVPQGPPGYGAPAPGGYGQPPQQPPQQQPPPGQMAYGQQPAQAGFAQPGTTQLQDNVTYLTCNKGTILQIEHCYD